MDREVFTLLDSANRLLLRHGLGERFGNDDIAIVLMVSIKLHEFADRLYSQLASEVLHGDTDARSGN